MTDCNEYLRLPFMKAGVSVEKLLCGTTLRVSDSTNIVSGDHSEEIQTVDFLIALKIPPRLLREAADRLEAAESIPQQV